MLAAHAIAALSARGYRFGALEIDAAALLPQSRPRVFVVAARDVAPGLVGESPFHTRAVRQAHAALPSDLADKVFTVMREWRAEPEET